MKKRSHFILRNFGIFGIFLTLFCKIIVALTPFFNLFSTLLSENVFEELTAINSCNSIETIILRSEFEIFALCDQFALVLRKKCFMKLDEVSSYDQRNNA